MVLGSDLATATLVFGAVTLSLPLYLYGAWIVIDNDPITWSILTRHLRYVVSGLVLTTVPVLTWMIPRLPGRWIGLAGVHAVIGLQAYAMLTFGMTGIVRIFTAKRRHDLYHDYDEELLLDEIGSENMDHWRGRLRIGVFGYLGFWLLAYLVGVLYYLLQYVAPRL